MRFKCAKERQLPVLSMTMRDGLVDQSAKFKKRVASSDTADFMAPLCDLGGFTAGSAKAKAKTKAKAKAKRAQNYSLQHLMVAYGVSIPQGPSTILLDQGIDASEESSAPCQCADCVNGVTPRKECNNEDDKYVIEVHRAHLEEPQWDPMRQPQRAPPEDCDDWTAPPPDPNQPNW